MSDVSEPTQTSAPTAEPESATEPMAAADPVDAVAPAAEGGRINRRKVREGVVASAAMDKTVVVRVMDRVRHSRYAKTVQHTKRLYAHDELNDARPGDRVRVQETRPLSRQKRWRLVEILERAR
jgi:small subunit ribosomal protein S17